jgi:site-specific DNA recombinase
VVADRAAAGAGLGADLGPAGVPADRQLRARPPAAAGRDHRHGCWPAIISPDDSDRLRALLSDQVRLQPKTHSYRYLLSGVFRCGLCGARLLGRAHGGLPRYQCIKDPGRPGCGKIAVFAHLAEPEARDKILTALSESPGLLGALVVKQHDLSAGPDGDDPGARLRGIDERRDELAAAWAAGEISRKEWATAKRVLDDQAAQLSLRIKRSAQALALAEFAALDGDMWHRWQHPQMTASARRALILACVHAIDVRPASHRRWDPDRIQPDWIT